MSLNNTKEIFNNTPYNKDIHKSIMFFRKRKCAGTAIVKSMVNSDLIVSELQVIRNLNIGKFNNIIDVSDVVCSLYQRRFKPKGIHILKACTPDCYTVAVVRNPWDRIVSGWNHFCTHDNKLKQSFESMVYNIDELKLINPQAWKHIMISQRNELCNAKGDIVIDRILRFEHLEEDWNQLCNDVGWGNIPLLTANVRKHPHYSTYFNDELIKKVGELLKDDIELLGYKFGD